ncbi:MAG: acyloxyacyl hydrolase [Acidobacteriota bacterium]
MAFANGKGLAIRMKWMVAAGLLVTTVGALAQDRKFDPKHEFSGFVEYSNDSSHMLIGQEENRKLLQVGVGYERRLKGNSIAAWRWEIDVQPLILLRNPLLTTDETVVYTGPPVTIYTGYPPGTYHFVVLANKDCETGSGTGQYYGTTSTGTTVPVETYTYSSVCTHPWTYGGGISPLGQTVNFFPKRRLQPMFMGNAGFVAFDKVTPSNNATMFNFSFEVGVGFQYFTRPGRAVTVDYRYHHISNAYRGQQNPGVDSGLLKVTYSFGR